MHQKEISVAVNSKSKRTTYKFLPYTKVAWRNCSTYRCKQQFAHKAVILLKRDKITAFVYANLYTCEKQKINFDRQAEVVL